ncbi:MAG: hypothetical protein VB858_06590 [Planctomycetaceae bacterium]
MRAVLTCLLVLSAGTVPAADAVYLRGAEVTKDHIVFGTVSFAGRSLATVNLGFAHGVRKFQQFLICRRLRSEIVPITVLTVRKVYPERSYGTLSTAFRAQLDDYALVPAGKLDIWGPESRLTTASRRQLMQRLNGNRYDTRNFSLSLTTELANDGAGKERESPDGTWGAFLARSQHFKAEAGVAENKPAGDSPQTAVGLTTEQGESKLLSVGFSRYLDQVVYAEGSELTGEALLRIPLDPRGGLDGIVFARQRRATLDNVAKRLFYDVNRKKFTDFVVPNAAQKNPY